jgi:hypothetical protein
MGVDSLKEESLLEVKESDKWAKAFNQIWGIIEFVASSRLAKPILRSYQNKINSNFIGEELNSKIVFALAKEVLKEIEDKGGVDLNLLEDQQKKFDQIINEVRGSLGFLNVAYRMYWKNAERMTLEERFRKILKDNQIDVSLAPEMARDLWEKTCEEILK